LADAIETSSPPPVGIATLLRPNAEHFRESSGQHDAAASHGSPIDWRVAAAFRSLI